MKMGKVGREVILITVLSSFFITAGYGQAALLVLILGDKVATEKFHLSIDGALNLSSLQNPGLGKNSLGVNFGLGTHLKLNDKWNLQTEFKPLSQKGAKSINPVVSIPAEIQADNTRLKLNYIDVPLMIQYKITPKLSIAAGPQISFLTSASQNTEGTLNGSGVSIQRDIKSHFNKIDFSIPAELRYSLTLARKKTSTKVDVDAFVRYSYGLTEIFIDPSMGSARISNFQFGFSLPFIKSAEELAKSKKN
jgi:hypothetical protein